MKIEIKILYNDERLKLHYATQGSAAMDIISPVAFNLHIQSQITVHTGIALSIGEQGSKIGCGLILPRSGRGSKGLVLKNTVGLIDADYQGELILEMFNNNFTDTNIESIKSKTCVVNKYEKIAQIMFLTAERAELNYIVEFSNTTERGVGGFGSTGDK